MIPLHPDDKPPQDRKLKHREILTWDGKRYKWHHPSSPFWDGRDLIEHGLYEVDSNDRQVRFVGPCTTLFEALKLIGAPIGTVIGPTQ